MFIQTEATPNPATLKFLPGKEVLAEGTADFRDAESAAAASPLAGKLFCDPRRDRRLLRLRFRHRHQGRRPGLAASEARHPRRHHGALHVGRAGHGDRRPGAADRAEQDGEFYDKADEEIVVTIKELLDTRVRPAVAQDGGDITFRGYENGTVFLHMKGACAGCPSSTATLKHGIQNLLRHFVPEVQQVEQVA